MKLLEMILLSTLVLGCSGNTTETGPEFCASAGGSNLPGVSLRFSDGVRCTYKQSEVVNSIQTPVEVVVETEVGPAFPDAVPCANGEVGDLAVTGVLVGAQPVFGPPKCDSQSGFADAALKVRSYSGAVEWTGREWDGSSAELGDLVPPGEYTLSLKSGGEFTNGGERFPYELEAHLSVVIEAD